MFLLLGDLICEYLSKHDVTTILTDSLDVPQALAKAYGKARTVGTNLAKIQSSWTLANRQTGSYSAPSKALRVSELPHEGQLSHNDTGLSTVEERM
jgi:hypothetical protein